MCSSSSSSIFFLSILLIFISKSTSGSSPPPAALPSRTLASFSAHGQINEWLRIPQHGGDPTKSRQWLVVGAVNRLYLLDLHNLTLAQEAVTGPVLDSPFCNAELSSCVGPRDGITETDTWNKLLVPLNASPTAPPDALLVCGSTRQGECHLRHLPSLGRLHRHPALSGPWQHISVAANAPGASTVSLLANDRLFVAASSIHETSPYREAFPAVATRLLSDGLQPVHAGSLDGEAAIHIRAEFRARLRVRYLLAFRDQSFVYFLAVQPASAQSGAPTVTRLARVCVEDDRYISYSELGLQCRSGEDNALFGVARAGAVLSGSGPSASSSPHSLFAAFTDADGRRSALCAFSLAKLRMMFWYNIDRCRAGTDSIGLPHIGRDAKCANRSHLPLGEDTCQLGVGGTLEATAAAIGQWGAGGGEGGGRVITALGAARVDERVLVVAGTERGEIIQMEIAEDEQRQTQSGRVYAEYRAAADPVSRIEILEDGSGTMLVGAGREVLLLSLSHCGSSSAASSSGSCADCLASGDPLCAWCLPLGRCTRPRECPSGSGSLRHCPQPQGPPRPGNVSLSASSSPPDVLLPLRALPRPLPDLDCVFGPSSAFRSRAKFHPEGILCPLASEMPRIAPGTDHLEVSVALRAAGTRADLVPPAKLTLFSCSTHQLCSACSSARWPCRWCASERKCVDSVEFGSTCPRERLRDSPSGCARILPPLPGSELLVPASTNSSLQFRLENMPSGDHLSPLTCRFGSNSSPPRSARLLQRDTVQCEPGPFEFEEAEAEKNVTLELVAAGGEPIDATTVIIYKCPLLATDCSRCVALDPRFACSWCDNECRHGSRCVRGTPVAGAMAADELCTRPAIHSFSPTSGPLEGGTRVEIRGRDLGSRVQDVQDRVRLAGVPCRVLHYEPSERVVCSTERAPGPLRGPARVTIGSSGRRSVESAGPGLFEFRSPQPQSVHPGFGPQSGGTRLELFGRDLDVGSNATVHLDNMECAVQERENERIACLTSASPRPYTVTAIRLQIDAAVRLLSAKFEYRPDPVVKDVQPRTAYESGGRNLTVTGSHLDSALSPKLFLLSPPTVPSAASDEMELVSELGPCRVLNSSALRCSAPRLALPTALLRQSAMARWSVGLAMDGVRAVRDLGSAIQLTTVPDPQFSPFAGVHILQSDQPLMLSGQWLSQAATAAEYTVTIGTSQCPVFLLEPDRLLCRPPASPPPPTDDSGAEMRDGRPLVVVRTGRVRAELGPLEYAGMALGEQVRGDLWSRRLGLGLFAALAAFGTVLGTVAWAWRRRQGEHEQTYRRIQLQMEQMESQVRSECKQAFAELQTDVLAELDGTVDDGAGIPFLDRREFLIRLLLRSATADPAGYGCGPIYSSQMPMVLAQFDSLLWNRQFIYVLVQMAEEDPSINFSDRSCLASMLLAVLSRNMAFASDVVLSLLSAHIQHCLLSRRAPLLFRHSDSLVEKLFQHWLTMALLPYLRDQCGPARPLFLLYRALKTMTEKGPVDAVTGQARYSLSEQSLLREPVDAHPLTILVIPLDGFDQAPMQVRVLDCDTISQLKAKLLDTLYRNTPFSARIGTDQFDLEWRCPRRGSVLLLDDDQPPTRRCGLAPRRLNTLARWGVPDLALLAMQSRALPPPATLTFRSSGSSAAGDSFGRGGWRSLSANQLLSSSSDSSGTSPTANGACSGCPGGAMATEYFHLTGGPNCETTKGREGTRKGRTDSNTSTELVAEVYLTRLLMCKGTLQRFVDTFFDSVLFADGQPIPFVLKYVFDFLDAEAAQSAQPVDADVVHAWKANCWVLRFWMPLVQCPDLLFDVEPSPRPAGLSGSLAVLGQTLVDSFSRSELDLSKESPSSKLLFARDVARLRPSAAELFRRVAAQPPIAPCHFFDYTATLSKMAGEGPSSTWALGELLNWAKANGPRLVESLEADPEAKRLRMGERLRQIVESTLEEEGRKMGGGGGEEAEGREEHVYATLS